MLAFDRYVEPLISLTFEYSASENGFRFVLFICYPSTLNPLGVYINYTTSVLIIPFL